MNLQQLEYFLYVKNAGSLNVASQHFFMTRQAINSSLKKMESEIGVSLFHYTNKGVTLTPQGMIFAPYAEKIVNTYMDALQELTQFQEQDMPLQGSITIYATSIFTDCFLSRIIRKFLLYHPQVNIHIMEIDNSDLSELLSHLVRDNTKIGLCSYTMDTINELIHKGTIPNLACMNLIDDSLVLCGRSDNPLMRYRAITLDDLTTRLMEFSPSFSLYQLTSFDGPGIFQDNIITRSSNAALHKSLMLEDISLTFMPKLAYRTQFETDGIRAIDIVTGTGIIHGILYREDTSNTLQQFFLKYLNQELRNIFSQEDLL